MQLLDLPLAVGFGSNPVLPRRLQVVPRPDTGRADEEWVGVGIADDGGDGAAPISDVVGLRSGRRVSTAGSMVDRDDAQALPTNASRSEQRARVEMAPLQLTARGRGALLLGAAGTGLAVVVAAWFGAGRAASTTPTAGAVPARVVVHSGDTLWSIAGRIAPNRDPRAVVDSLLRLNRLTSPSVVPGQVLRTH